MDDPHIKNEELADLLWSLYQNAFDEITSIPIEYKTEYADKSSGVVRDGTFKVDHKLLGPSPSQWREYDEFDLIVDNLLQCDYFELNRDDFEANKSRVRGAIQHWIIGLIWHAYITNLDTVGEMDEDIFVDVFVDFETYCISDDIPVVATAIFKDVSIDESPIDLRPNLRIRDVTASDLNTVLQYDLNKGLNLAESTCVVECEYTRSRRQPPRTDYPREGLEKVKTALRLFASEIEPVFAYSFVESKLLYKRDMMVPNIVQPPLPDSIPRSTRSPSGNLTTAEAEEFIEFYRSREHLIRTESDDREFARPLRRYNEMFRKKSPEDCIVDAVIALESTLLSNIQNTSYTFRMGLRGGILLEDYLPYTRSEIRSFLKTLYFARGEIVHSDLPMEQIIEKIENHDGYDFAVLEVHRGREYIQEARYVLSAVLRAYMDTKIDRGLSIDDTNLEIDEAAQSATYP